MKRLKETNHDYQGALSGNFHDRKMNGTFSSWNEFKENFAGFSINDPTFSNYDDTYHFVFRYDIFKVEDKDKYYLELCVMLQRKGIYLNLEVNNISEEELNGEIKLWLEGRAMYMENLWKEVKQSE